MPLGITPHGSDSAREGKLDYNITEAYENQDSTLIGARLPKGSEVAHETYASSCFRRLASVGHNNLMYRRRLPGTQVWASH